MGFYFEISAFFPAMHRFDTLQVREGSANDAHHFQIYIHTNLVWVLKRKGSGVMDTLPAFSSGVTVRLVDPAGEVIGGGKLYIKYLFYYEMINYSTGSLNAYMVDKVCAGALAGQTARPSLVKQYLHFSHAKYKVLPSALNILAVMARDTSCNEACRL